MKQLILNLFILLFSLNSFANKVLVLSDIGSFKGREGKTFDQAKQELKNLLKEIKNKNIEATFNLSFKSQYRQHFTDIVLLGNLVDKNSKEKYEQMEEIFKIFSEAGFSNKNVHLVLGENEAEIDDCSNLKDPNKLINKYTNHAFQVDRPVKYIYEAATKKCVLKGWNTKTKKWEKLYRDKLKKGNSYFGHITINKKK